MLAAMLALLPRRWIGIAVAGLLGAAVLASGGGQPVDRRLAELRDALLSHSASGDVRIVEIDAKSLAKFDKWPWPRNIHAAIVDRLVTAGARSIAFDVDFSSASTPAADARLAAALDRAGGRVILPTFRQNASSLSSQFIDALPIAEFRSKAFLAAVNVVPDADGYVRQMPLGLRTASLPRPSLAAMIAERNAQIDRTFDIDYSIRPETIPRFSVADLLAGRVPVAALAGKRILIGATAIEMGDRYAVPRHGVEAGVVIQALAAETLLQGPLPRSWSGVLPLLLALLIVSVASRRRRRDERAAILIATTLLLPALAFAAYAGFGIGIPLAPTLAMLLALAALGLTGWILERFQERAHTDAGTGMPNLAALEVALADQETAAMVVARIEEFSTIASALGPELASIFVQRVADRLRFASANGIIYRIDEASLAWSDGNPADFEDRIEALAAVMRSPIDCGRLIDAPLHYGLAQGPGCVARQLVANAGLAAANAARDGQPWARLSAADSDRADWQLTLLGEIEAALRSGQIWNAYQPKLDLKSRRILGAEALARWEHPKHGLIPPDVFIPLVERAGRIRDLTLHVLHQAMDDALAWQEQGYDLNVAVNVSARLLTDHEFIELVGQTLGTHLLPADRITFEVTETATMTTPERAITALEGWRALGVRISVDDYGTGQSSLGYLQKLPASELKIDKSFVQTLCRDPRNAAMVRSTIALAHELGLTAVAEGVEDAECLAALQAMGCDKAQGYFIGRPSDIHTFTRMLEQEPRAAA